MELLLLAHFWDMVEAQNVVQHKIITVKVIDPFNIDASTSSDCCMTFVIFVDAFFVLS
jgi:hypothetical protein